MIQFSDKFHQPPTSACHAIHHLSEETQCQPLSTPTCMCRRIETEIKSTMSQKSPQASTLPNVTDWLKAVAAQQAKGDDDNNGASDASRRSTRIKQVTDEAILGLQMLHTAVVREIMQRAIDTQEREEEEARAGKGKKRKVIDILQQAHQDLDLTNEWEEALAFQNNMNANNAPKQVKAQRKKARKHIDPNLLEQQELMLKKSLDKAMQEKDAKWHELALS